MILKHLLTEEGSACFSEDLGCCGCDSGTTSITDLLESIPLSTGALC